MAKKRVENDQNAIQTAVQAAKALREALERSVAAADLDTPMK